MVGDEEVLLTDRLTWEREGDWIPHFYLEEGPLLLTGRLVCPIGERGFFYTFQVKNRSDQSFYCGLSLELAWASILHSINVTKPLSGEKVLVSQSWEDMPVLEFRAPSPRVALAPYAHESGSRFFYKKGLQALKPQGRETLLASNDTLHLQWLQSRDMKPGAVWNCHFYFGLGPDEIGAFASAREMKRAGAPALFQKTLKWLSDHRRQSKDPELEKLMNTNAFFNRFYATGTTLDTEETVALTSRSPRYYVSGAYWDRDSLLWSLPSLIEVDRDQARKVLHYVFTRQARNFGTHSRYLSGAVLEPGFELDELCAPVIGLKKYVMETNDLLFLNLSQVREALPRFEEELKKWKHPKRDMYQTWLLPSDDPWPQRFITYDNVLVWRALLDLGFLYRKLNDGKNARRVESQAFLVKKTVMRYCLMKGSQGRHFAWSVDLNQKGSAMMYDEPPGSLLLLPYYEFCKATLPTWKRTRDWIYSSANPYSFKGSPFEEVGTGHAKHPWVLSAVNSLLANQKDRALAFLKKVSMDNGLACESVNEKTGEVATGEAFATCAGFLAYGLWHVMGKKKKVRKRR